MPTLFNYLFALFLSSFFKVLGIFVGFFFLVDGVEMVRRLARFSDVSGADLTLLAALRMPNFLTQFLPAIALLAALNMITRLSTQSEIIAMRAGGVSIYRILIPILFAGGLIASSHFLILDQIVSRTQEAARTLERQLRGDAPPNWTATAQTGLWLRDGDSIIRARQASPNDQTLFDVTVYRFQHPFQLAVRLDARKAVREDGQWFLLDGVRYQFLPVMNSASFERLPWESTIEAKQLERENPPPEALPLIKLWQFTNQLQREGYDAGLYQVILHRRLADPLTSLIAIIMAVPFSLRLSRSGGQTRALITGIGAGFLLFVVVDFTSALGMGGRLPPVLAAWAPAILFGSLSAWFLIHIEEDLLPPRHALRKAPPAPTA